MCDRDRDTHHSKSTSWQDLPRCASPKWRGRCKVKGRCKVSWWDPPSSAGVHFTEHCWLRCGLVKRLLHRQKRVKCCFTREVPPCVYVPLGLEVCAHFCCSALAVTPKANTHKRNTTRRLLSPNAGNHSGFFYFFSKPRDLLKTSVL